MKGQSNPLVAGFCPSFPQDSWGRESVRIRLSVMWLLSGKAMHERHYGDSVSPDLPPTQRSFQPCSGE